MAKLPLFDTPFDTYQATEIIGEGGVGIVYGVTNSSGEEFALKRLSPERVTSERLKRFKNEIAFCQRLDHRNIVKVLDTGSTTIRGQKCPFYVMRRFTGTLRTHMHELQDETPLKAFAQLLDGVEAAHLSNVWHRDLKPENVLWANTDETLVIADFGIAHFEQEDIYTAVETKVASRMANFLYSAPEQRVRGATVDRRADIFSLGLILNELFTGEVPQGAGFKRVSEISSAHSYLDEIVDSMIQQSPDKRPSTIEVIKKDLIGHKNAFVALQGYDAAKKQIIPTTSIDNFEPLTLVNFDYSNGTLSLRLSGNVAPGWVQEFQHPRGGYTSLLGYGPEAFDIRGNVLRIQARQDERFIQQLVDHAKKYVAAANSGYAQQRREQAAAREREERAALEQKVKEAELRKSILSKVRL